MTLFPNAHENRSWPAAMQVRLLPCRALAGRPVPGCRWISVEHSQTPRRDTSPCRTVHAKVAILLACVLWGHVGFCQSTFKPVPRVQALPLPQDQISFQRDGIELTRYHYGTHACRPFLYPVMGPESGRSLTRMGHPHDPLTHRHHYSVWLSHQFVNGANFWEDNTNQVVHQRIEKIEDGMESASVTVYNHWCSGGKILMGERRQLTVLLLAQNEWLLLIDSCLEAAQGDVILGQTGFGLIGVRVAKSIGVNDGNGILRNSEGATGETNIFRLPAKWVDYSGAITSNHVEGITLMDHPKNPDHPSPFHVRSDGWMGCCLNLAAPHSIARGRSLSLRYGLYVHSGIPEKDRLNRQFEHFIGLPVTDLTVKPKP